MSRFTQSGDIPISESIEPDPSYFRGEGVDIMGLIQEQYRIFLKYSMQENSFLDAEISEIIRVLNTVSNMAQKSPGSGYPALLTNMPYSLLKLNNDIIIDFGSTGVPVFKNVSLNIAMYFLFCAEQAITLQDEDRKFYTADTFRSFVSDRLKGKRYGAFWY